MVVPSPSLAVIEIISSAMEDHCCSSVAVDLDLSVCHVVDFATSFDENRETDDLPMEADLGVLQCHTINRFLKNQDQRIFTAEH